jgi:hypothetical protein
MTWTPEREQSLAQQWADGYSATIIAAQLGVTRNAVIGKVHRLELSARRTRRARQRRPRAPMHRAPPTSPAATFRRAPFRHIPPSIRPRRDNGESERRRERRDLYSLLAEAARNTAALPK